MANRSRPVWSALTGLEATPLQTQGECPGLGLWRAFSAQEWHNSLPPTRRLFPPKRLSQPSVLQQDVHQAVHDLGIVQRFGAQARVRVEAGHDGALQLVAQIGRGAELLLRVVPRLRPQGTGSTQSCQEKAAYVVRRGGMITKALVSPSQISTESDHPIPST